MNEKVRVYIEGIVRDGDDISPITTKAVGVYRNFKGRHIIRYKEPENEENKASINTIKISSGQVEMIKKGENSTHMVFDLSKQTYSSYDTPYGSLNFQINTSRINIEEKVREINIHMEYTLSLNDSHISDNQLIIKVTSN
ncbi:DUF1934 domain-containing protein [Herbinix luporum]|jgi:uncharacterized beta-barrel protein YwiB (DUF1934 family)|uniref:DUF1934 domain-containing protein n=1 Tax=Herbinix luporum TaxID=1679721 RepID=A0A0K8J9A7_9FIRM|nr:DUF1934 domain-containing protein [Herbinix luporum]MDI9487839.1 DUF1934 domain-containing protein [Bacillota bacterium]CUH93848.1 hypothetical protein SD1D_2336 [Herbinix luporum]HHT57623.1 DUF1934 domain-containing protein [Herbinix luporum]